MSCLLLFVLGQLRLHLILLLLLHWQLFLQLLLQLLLFLQLLLLLRLLLLLQLLRHVVSRQPQHERGTLVMCRVRQQQQQHLRQHQQ